MTRRKNINVERRGGYRGLRNPVTGMTPYEELISIKRRREELKYAQERGLLVIKSDVDSGMKECAAVIQSDLFGSLPSRLATVLGGKKRPAEQVRQAALEIVDEIVKNWISAEIIPKESKPNEPDNPYQASPA